MSQNKRGFVNSLKTRLEGLKTALPLLDNFHIYVPAQTMTYLKNTLKETSNSGQYYKNSSYATSKRVPYISKQDL